MENITKEILRFINNDHTKVEVRQDIKGNYYSYLLDTIYVSENIEKKKAKTIKNVNAKAANLVMLSHECVHSIQMKWLHILNIVLSNLSIVMTLIYIVVSFACENNIINKITTLATIITGIVVRLILEQDAIKRSIVVAKEFTDINNINNINQDEFNVIKSYISKNTVFALVHMIIDKIIMFILILMI